MNMRPMTKEDNAVYASRSGLVLMAGKQIVQAKDAAISAARAARAADKALNPAETFVKAVTASIDYWNEQGPFSPNAVY